MAQLWLAILISLVAIIVLDFLWGMVIAKNIYKKVFKEIGNIVKGKWKMKYAPVILTWVFILLGLMLFAQDYSFDLLSSFVAGCMFGFIVYGIYDLTNLASIKSWTIKITIIDIIWGTLLCGFVNFVFFSVLYML